VSLPGVCQAHRGEGTYESKEPSYDYKTGQTTYKEINEVVPPKTECWLIGWDSGLLCAVCYYIDTYTAYILLHSAIAQIDLCGCV
jgi:hypothetical protein